MGLAKGALSVFDCTQNKDGKYILDADPSIKCDEVGQGGWGTAAIGSPCSRTDVNVPGYATLLTSLCAGCVSSRWSSQAGGVQEALKPAAAFSIVVYTLGLPAAFLTILIRHRDAIYADQTLRMANQGASDATNPNFHIRRRYQELYR